MSAFQQRIADVTRTRAKLIAQLRELDQLRERVREAETLRLNDSPSAQRGKRLPARAGYSEEGRRL
jgi:hypothetical protein